MFAIYNTLSAVFERNCRSKHCEHKNLDFYRVVLLTHYKEQFNVNCKATIQQYFDISLRTWAHVD